MEKKKNRITKPVALNLTKVEDQKILNHVKRRNFSGYVKKLILADIQKVEIAKHEIEANKAVTIDTPKEVLEQPKSATDRLATLKQRQKQTGSQPGPKTYLSK